LIAYFMGVTVAHPSVRLLVFTPRLILGALYDLRCGH
jgi:hypothetical protein